MLGRKPCNRIEETEGLQVAGGGCVTAARAAHTQVGDVSSPADMLAAMDGGVEAVVALLRWSRSHGRRACDGKDLAHSLRSRCSVAMALPRRHRSAGASTRRSIPERQS